MQIKIISTNAKPLSSVYTQVIFTEKGVESFSTKDGIATLTIETGKLKHYTPRRFRTLIRTIIQAAKKYKISKIVVPLTYASFPKCHIYSVEWFWSTVAENVYLAHYEYNVYKSTKPKIFLNEVCFITGDTTKAKEGIQRGTILGTAVNTTRDLANTPGGDMTPKLLADGAKMALKGTKTKITVLDEPTIKKLRMGGLLGVGKGAKEKPRFIIIEYYGGKKSEAPLVFVGKGITFDTGGLQVKPGMAMYEMHMDMSGGASVIGALKAIALLGIKKNVIGLIPAAENAISDEAIRPGDVLTMMSGTTVDVLHTDAEGRLVLADALHYARTYNPKLVVDIATLTGAALVAVGQHASVIMTRDRNLEDTFRDLGEQSGDYVFPLPLWDEYKQYTKGANADISNIPINDTRNGGSINGGMFLSHFTQKMKWVHIDMAPRMTSVGSDKLAKGATGEPVRLLVSIAESY